MESTSAAIATSNLLLIFSAIAITGIVCGKLSEKVNLPDVVLFLIAGIIMGPAFLNLVSIESYPIENNLLLTFGSAFILYEGGREIKLKVLNKVKTTVGLLASIGVVISAVVVAFAAQVVFKIDFIYALLIGSVIASTDPATLIPVFQQVNIKDRVKQTVVSESAFNDATGAILVSAVLAIITSGKISIAENAKQLVIMIVVGALVGVIFGYVFSLLISDKKSGIFHQYAPIISVLIVALSYEIATLLHGSGYMAVFIAGLISGNKKVFGLWVPEQSFQSELHFRESVSTLARMGIFVILGTQIDIISLSQYWLPSLIIVLVLMFIARPLSIIPCAMPDREAKWSWKEMVFMMWVRETGVIPAALSGIIVAMKIPGYQIVSSVVFMTILITLLLQASTTKIVARKLGVLEEEEVQKQHNVKGAII
jgi:NhaP-type Na+/H+ or K+/H+ antiporter